MRYLLTIAEQLDRAARELLTDHAINNRLALILIDDATELLVDRQCKGRLDLDRATAPLQEAVRTITKRLPSKHRFEFPKHSADVIMRPKQRAMAKGRYFDGKLKVLENFGDITKEEKQFIRIAHHYRNDVYHIGLMHDDILRAVSGHYYLLCCDLLSRLDGSGFWGLSFSSDDEYTEVSKRYLPKRNGRIVPREVEVECVAEQLRGTLPEGIPGLTKTLAHSARTFILQIDEGVLFLKRENPFGLNEDGVLEVAQWNFDLNKALQEEGIIGLWIDPNYRNNVRRVGENLAVTWKQKHTSLPFQKWFLRADFVENQTDPLVAMQLFDSLREDMEYLEGAITEATEELDMWIQHQIDKKRGK